MRQQILWIQVSYDILPHIIKIIGCIMEKDIVYEKSLMGW